MQLKLSAVNVMQANTHTQAYARARTHTHTISLSLSHALQFNMVFGLSPQTKKEKNYVFFYIQTTFCTLKLKFFYTDFTETKICCSIPECVVSGATKKLPCILLLNQLLVQLHPEPPMQSALNLKE